MDYKELMGKFMKICQLHRNTMETTLAKNDIGIHRAQHRMLMSVADSEEACQRELAKEMMISAATVTVSMKKLEKDGYVKRIMKEEDNRYNKLHITEKGIGVVNKSREIFNNIDKRLFQGFSEEECRKFDECLNRILGNLKEIEKE